MALYYNTEKYVNIANDLKNQINSGNLSIDQAEEYLRQTHDVSAEEYSKATTQALEAEQKYFKMKKEFESSPISFIGISSTFIPAHLREQEESTVQSIINFPARVLQSGIRGLGTGLPDLGGMILPEKISEPISEIASDVDDALEENKYTSGVYKALKSTFDPATTGAEEITGDIATLVAGGIGVASKIGKAAPILKQTLGGAIPTIAGFTVADIVVTDKNQNIANILIQEFPETEEYLARLAIDENDSDAMKLLKKATEGVVIGGIAEGVFKGAAKAYRVLKGKKKAIIEDDILTPPKDTSGKIKDVEIKETPDGEFQHKISISQPVDILTDPKFATESTGAKGFYKRWFESRQGFDPQTFRALEGLDAEVRGARKLAQQESRDFVRVLQKEYGTKLKNIAKEDLEIINEALGKVPNPGIGASKQILKIFGKAPNKRTPAEKKLLREHVAKITANAKQSQVEALEKLPENVRQKIMELRQSIDARSLRLREMGLAPKISTAIDNKIGLYVTADYEIFTNPQWLKRIKAAVKGSDDVEATQIVEGVRRWIKRTHPKYNQTEVQGKLDEIINAFESGEESFFKFLGMGKNARTDQHPLSKSLDPRKPFPEEIRALLKEVDNPVDRFTSTINKQSKLIAEHNFLSSMRTIAESGYGSKLFRISKRPLTEGDTSFIGNMEEIANSYIRAQGKKANPLAGVYTTKSYKDMVAKGLDFNTPNNKILRALHSAQALASGAQTVMSEATHLINLQGNVVFSIANGNVMPWSMLGKDSVASALKKVATASPDFNRLVLRMKGNKLKISTEEFRNLQRRGLIDSGVTQEFFSRSLEAGLSNPIKLLNPVAKTYKALGELYRGEDAIFKVFNYYRELAKYRKAYPKLTEDQLQVFAAEIVKDTLPTYSRIPRALKATRIAPVVGAFPSFLVESFRVAKNTAKIGARDFGKGLATGNLSLMRIGAERLAGLTAVGVAGEGYLISNNQEKGVTETDDKVVSILSAFYNKDSVRRYEKPMMLNPKTGHIETTYTNISRNDPYDAVRKFAKLVFQYATSEKMTDPEQIEETIEKLALVFDPVITESLAIEPILNLLAKRKGRRDLFPEGATPDQITAIVVKELGMTYVPKTITDIIKYQQALDSDREKDKKGYDSKLTKEELDEFSAGTSKFGFPNRAADRLKRFYGITQSTFNFNKSLQYKVAKKNSEINNIKGQLFSSLRELQAGYTGSILRTHLSDPKIVEELNKKVDEYVLKTYRSQQDLAEILRDSQKLNYYTKDKGKLIPRTMDAKKLKAILTEKEFVDLSPNVEPALLFGVGQYKPPLIDVKRAETLEGVQKVPREIILAVQQRLEAYAKRNTPLLKKEE
jgi:hypothetical protein|tara:strand:+ start:462 stop:4520 length:4059 start_codon:yes stop_codon:yes gene_type:complete